MSALFGPGMDALNRTLDDHAARPRIRPFLEDAVAVGCIFQALHETALRRRVIRSQEKSQQIQAVHILFEETTEICGYCVRAGWVGCDLASPQHFTSFFQFNND